MSTPDSFHSPSGSEDITHDPAAAQPSQDPAQPQDPASRPQDPTQPHPDAQYAPQAPNPQYAPPQYASPPQYPAPQYAPPQYPAPQPTGAAAWALGLIALAFIPFVAAVASCIAMLIASGPAIRRGGISAVNGRGAANWALTYLIATVLLVGGHILLLFVFAGDEPVRGFFPLGIPITLWGLISLAHIVFSIIGLVRASGHRTFRAPAIPFLRAST